MYFFKRHLLTHTLFFCCFFTGNECTVGKWQFVFDGVDSKASSITEKLKEYFPITIKYGCNNLGSTWKINSEMLHTARMQCICGAMAQWTVEPYLLTYLSVKEVLRSLPPASLSKRYFSPIDSIEEAQLTDYQVNKFKEKAFGGESNCHKWRGVLEALTNTVWWWPGKLQSERTICWHRLFWLEVITRFRC